MRLPVNKPILQYPLSQEELEVERQCRLWSHLEEHLHNQILLEQEKALNRPVEAGLTAPVNVSVGKIQAWKALINYVNKKANG
jgi:hypothetical protein